MIAEVRIEIADSWGLEEKKKPNVLETPLKMERFNS